MSARRIPIIPTIIVAAAVATMIALGFWQLGRLKEKEALLARYAQATAMSSEVRWPQSQADIEDVLYRHTSLDCSSANELPPIAGQSAQGESGWAHRVSCALSQGGEAEIVIGWSRDPATVEWDGGMALGVVSRAGDGIRLVASPPLAGLEPNALPDPSDIPNNHLSYAVQWFLFALTAVVIYVLALRKKQRGL